MMGPAGISRTHHALWNHDLPREAKVFLITADDVERERIKAHAPHRQVHHKANEVGSGHVRDDRKFFDKDPCRARGCRRLADRRSGEAGVEPMDHPTDGELLAHARKLLKAHDRMAPHDARRARARLEHGVSRCSRHMPFG